MDSANSTHIAFSPKVKWLWPNVRTCGMDSGSVGLSSPNNRDGT